MGDERRVGGDRGVASGFRCRSTPSTCMDDLCRNSAVGLCGNIDDFDPEDDEWGAD